MYYIYKIENKINHKKYIGLTNNVTRRKNRHFTDLKRGVHDNQFLQKEYNIYGKDNFLFTVEYSGEVTSEEISQKEREYIAYYDSYRNGYNQNEGGNFGPTNGGSKLTQEDVFIILSVLEFTERPGHVLSKHFDVTPTQISRIKQGVSHSAFYREYYSKTLSERKKYFNDYNKLTNIEQEIISSHTQKNRRFSEEQIFMILVNSEFHIMPVVHIAEHFHTAPYNVTLIIKGKIYKDINIKYNLLTQAEKQKFCDRVRQLAQEKSF